MDLRPGGGGEDGERHGDAVIAAGVARDALAQGRGAFDPQPVRVFAAADAQGGQGRDHGADAVGLLDPELGRAAHLGPAAGEGRGGAQHGHLVHQGGDLGRFDARRGQVPPADDEVGHRLSAHLRERLDIHGRAHPAQDREESGPERVDAHARDPQFGPGHASRQHHEEGRGREVAGHRDVQGGKGPGRRPDRDRACRGLDRDPQGPEHPLGVVAGGRGLDHGHGAVRSQAGEQERRLHLRRGHDKHVAHAPQGPPMKAQRGPGAARAPRDASAHRDERRDHAVHRPLPQVLVPRNTGRERPAGQDSGADAGRGPGVPGVHDVVRLAQPMQAGAGDAKLGRRDLDDSRAEGAHHRDRTQRVLCVQEAAHPARTVRKTREHDRAVADGLVPGHDDGAADRCSPGHERPRDLPRTSNSSA